MNARLYAKVIVDISNANVDRLFTYAVPDELALSAGQRVLVPFGAGNKRVEGFVMELLEQAGDTGFAIKRIIRAMEPYPAFTADQLALAIWMKEAYHCPLVDALRLMIPAQLRGGRVREQRIRMIAFANGMDYERAKALLMGSNGASKAPRQTAVLEALNALGGSAPMQEISLRVDGASAAVGALIKKGVLAEEGWESFRDPFLNPVNRDEPMELTESQSLALARIGEQLAARSGVSVLHGVTGSGKTEVYMHAIAGALKDGGRAIVLVPEIALTPQAMERYRNRFGERVAVLHSRLSPGERYDQWRRIRFGQVDVVIGARSAVFAPLDDLRLIIIDEEHEEGSYQSESVPRYAASEVALKRAKLCGAVLVLGSATPSMLTYSRAKRGQYQLLELPRRINERPLPEVVVADMRLEFLSGNSSIFSAALYSRLEQCLSAGDQAILFINRRGYSTFVSCRGCGYVFKCPNCDVALTYHRSEGLMKCHYCGHAMRLPKECPVCEKPYIKYFGVGTEQVEDQLHKLFPGARALRMDSDTTRTRNAHHQILSRFATGEADVLIGTQMVAKGLDMPDVTLVGVIAADSALYIPDYRSVERTFQLITQVAGRAGRADKSGSVVVQTYSPEHPAIGFAARQDYKAFYEYEMAARRAALLPPFSLFVRILFMSGVESVLEELSAQYAGALERAITDALIACGGDPRELLYIAASPSPVARRQGLYRYQVLIKLVRTKHTRCAVDAVFAYCEARADAVASHPEINPGDMF